MLNLLIGFAVGFFLCMVIMGYLGKKELDKRQALLQRKLTRKRYRRSV